jgi:hypothetical protein
MSLPNLYLDLDETLIYSVDNRYSKKDLSEFTCHIFENYTIMERPNLQKFLDWIFKNFHVSIWSAASPDYVKFIVDKVIATHKRKPKYVLHSEFCDKSNEKYGEIKKLEMLWDHYKLPGHNHSNTFLLDDLYSNVEFQPDNSLRIKKFQGDKNDKELVSIKNILETLLKIYKEKNKLDIKKAKKSKKSPLKK